MLEMIKYITVDSDRLCILILKVNMKVQFFFTESKLLMGY